MSPLSDAQKAMRRTGISASELATVCGLNPYGSPLQVWRSKVLGEEVEETLPMEIGTALEPVLLRRYEKRFGVKLLPGETMRSKDHPLILATPDGVRPDGTPVEAKQADNFSMWEDWGEDGTDQVPEHYRVQSIVQQGVMDAPYGDLIAILSRYDVRCYRVPFDKDHFSMLVEIGERFFQDHVATEKPPEPDGSDAWNDFIKKRFPEERGPLEAASHEVEALAKEWLSHKAVLDSTEETLTRLRQQIEWACGDAEGFNGDGWKLLWRASKGRPSVDWKGLVAHLGVTDEMVEHWTRYTPVRPFRLMRVKAGKAKEAV